MDREAQGNDIYDAYCLQPQFLGRNDLVLPDTFAWGAPTANGQTAVLADTQEVARLLTVMVVDPLACFVNPNNVSSQFGPASANWSFRGVRPDGWGRLAQPGWLHTLQNADNLQRLDAPTPNVPFRHHLPGNDRVVYKKRIYTLTAQASAQQLLDNEIDNWPATNPAVLQFIHQHSVDWTLHRLPVWYEAEHRLLTPLEIPQLLPGALVDVNYTLRRTLISNGNDPHYTVYASVDQVTLLELAPPPPTIPHHDFSLGPIRTSPRKQLHSNKGPAALASSSKGKKKKSATASA